MKRSKRFKRIRAAALALIVCGLAAGGYNIAKDWTTAAPQSEEAPKLADAPADGATGQGGDISGESGGQAGSGREDEGEGAAGNGGSEGSGGQEDGAKPVYSNGGQAGGDEDMAVIAQPDSVTAMVNKFNRLPDDYAPDDLVYPDVRFTFNEQIEKRMLRKEAAEALEDMFAAAEKDGIYLAGVSAYRSHETQKALFNRYVKQDGYEKARTYSALPGTSEHETGLAIDVTSSDGKCAVQDCFGGTKESDWLEEHAAEFGFIIRYPKGKEDITGYKYEPWHLRYVGRELAEELAAEGLTMEEYYNAVPVAQ